MKGEKPDEKEPETDAELVTMLRALYTAGDYSGGARDDFWDLVSNYIGWILDLAERGAKKPSKAARGAAGGRARMAALSPERRSEIAKQAAAARWQNANDGQPQDGK